MREIRKFDSWSTIDDTTRKYFPSDPDRVDASRLQATSIHDPHKYMAHRHQCTVWPKALLLSLHGTLVDSEAAQLWAFNAVLATYCVQMSTRTFYDLALGNSTEAVFAALIPHLDANQLKTLAAAKEALLLSAIDRVTPTAGARALLRAAMEAKCCVGIVTNVPQACASALLSELSLGCFVTALISVDDQFGPAQSDARHSLALQNLGVVAEESLAIEHSIRGVISARRAGLQVVGVTGSRSPTPLLRVGASECFATLAQIGVEYGFI